MSTALVVTRDEPYGKSKHEIIQAYHDFLKTNNIDQKTNEVDIQRDLYDIAHLCPFVSYKIEKKSSMAAKKEGARFISRVTITGANAPQTEEVAQATGSESTEETTPPGATDAKSEEMP